MPRRSVCNICRNAAVRERYAADPEYAERKREVSRKTQEKHREAIRAARRDRKYGLPPGWFDTQWEAQGGRCAICSVPFGTDRYRDVANVDHCHATGRPRGLLCHLCNRALGLLADDPERLRRAIAYLAAV